MFTLHLLNAALSQTELSRRAAQRYATVAAVKESRAQHRRASRRLLAAAARAHRQVIGPQSEGLGC